MQAHQVRGRIVLVSSVVGFMGLVGYAQYAPMKYAIRGLAECLRSELPLYGIDVHCYFPATILSPGYDEENKTKPQVTKDIEGADDAKTPEQCAVHLARGVARGDFFITDGLVGSLLRASSSGCAPGNGLWKDAVLALPARVGCALRCLPSLRFWAGAGGSQTGWCVKPNIHRRGLSTIYTT